MKDTYYFQHDFAAASDFKLQALMSEFSGIAYAVYFGTVELLHQESTHKLPLANYFYKALSNQLVIKDPELVEKIIRSCIDEYNLFEEEDGYFYSKRVNQNLTRREEIRKIRQEAGRKGGKASGQQRSNDEDEIYNGTEDEANAKQNEPNTKQLLKQNQAKGKQTEAIAKQKRSKSNQRKGKEKEKKEKKYIFINFQDSEFVLEYISENLPNVSSMRRAMTLEEADQLISIYGKEKVIDKLVSMENRPTLKKDYAWAYRTCLEWLKRHYGNIEPDTNTKKEIEYTATGIPIPEFKVNG